MIARSRPAAVPITRPATGCACRPSLNDTVSVRAPRTTWSFVTMIPARSITTPEPSPLLPSKPTVFTLTTPGAPARRRRPCSRRSPPESPQAPPASPSRSRSRSPSSRRSPRQPAPAPPLRAALRSRLAGSWQPLHPEQREAAGGEREQCGGPDAARSSSRATPLLAQPRGEIARRRCSARRLCVAKNSPPVAWAIWRSVAGSGGTGRSKPPRLSTPPGVPSATV